MPPAGPTARVSAYRPDGRCSASSAVTTTRRGDQLSAACARQGARQRYLPQRGTQRTDRPVSPREDSRSSGSQRKHSRLDRCIGRRRRVAAVAGRKMRTPLVAPPAELGRRAPAGASPSRQCYARVRRECCRRASTRSSAGEDALRAGDPTAIRAARHPAGPPRQGSAWSPGTRRRSRTRRTARAGRKRSPTRTDAGPVPGREDDLATWRGRRLEVTERPDEALHADRVGRPDDHDEVRSSERGQRRGVPARGAGVIAERLVVLDPEPAVDHGPPRDRACDAPHDVERGSRQLCPARRSGDARAHAARPSRREQARCRGVERPAPRRAAAAIPGASSSSLRVWATVHRRCPIDQERPGRTHEPREPAARLT